MSRDSTRYQRLLAECEADRELWSHSEKQPKTWRFVMATLLISGGMSAALGAMLMAVTAL